MTNLDDIIVGSVEEVRLLDLIYPVKARPLFSIASHDNFDIAHDSVALIDLVAAALEISATGQVLIISSECGDETEESTNLDPREPNNDVVICPQCAYQFRAIPINVQKELTRLQESIDNCSTEEGLCYAVELEGKNQEIADLREYIENDWRMGVFTESPNDLVPLMEAVKKSQDRFCLGCGQPSPCPSDCPAGSLKLV